MEHDNLREILPLMEKASRKAGELIMENYGKGDYQTKQPGEAYTGFDKIKKSFVTKIDTKAQTIILQELLLFKQLSVFAEESDPEIIELISKFSPNSEYSFVVDPLDGTANYLTGNAEIMKQVKEKYLQHYKEEMPDNSDKFGVCITFTKQKVPIATVIYYPFHKTTLSVTKEKGALLNNNKTHLPLKQVHDFSDPIRISQYSPLVKCKNLFKNQKSYQSSSYNLKALLEGDILCYSLNSIDYLDFVPTLLAYKAAGGFIGDEKAEPIKIPELVKKIDQNGRLNQFMLLCPTQEYCKSLLKNLKGLI